jgi:hypothetical protein
LQAVGKGVPPPGFGIALLQRVVVGIQENDPEGRAHRAQAGDDIGKLGQFAR